MTKLLSFILIIISVNSFAQNKDSLDYDLNIVGDWIFDYYVLTNLDGKVRDTIVVRSDTLRMYTGLRIGPRAVDEFFDLWDFPEDSTFFMGVGPWTIEKEGNITRIDFDCEGFVLCGVYELISVTKEELILRHCFHLPEDGCEILHLKKKYE